MQSFGHLECLNPSIIDVMGYCSRIRKKVTENREQRTENRETNYRGHSNCQWIIGLRGPTMVTVRKKQLSDVLKAKALALSQEDVNQSKLQEGWEYLVDSNKTSGFC